MLCLVPLMFFIYRMSFSVRALRGDSNLPSPDRIDLARPVCRRSCPCSSQESAEVRISDPDMYQEIVDAEWSIIYDKLEK